MNGIVEGFVVDGDNDSNDKVVVVLIMMMMMHLEAKGLILYG